MQTIRYLTDPAYADFAWPAVLGAAASAVMCAALSPLVVLKRLAFIGQGVSHAAFGGVGIAFALGITGMSALGASALEAAGQEFLLLGIVMGFCIVAALGIARLGRRGAEEADTAIGVVLVGAMALGSLLVSLAATHAARTGRPPPPSVESVLFGSFTSVSWATALLAWVIAGGIVVALAWRRRPLLFWAFDEPVATAYGVRGPRVQTMLHVLLAIAIVMTMRLAGVVLATALLVLPGAAALKLSSRLQGVMGWSLALGATGVLGGLVLSFEINVQPGACIVGVQIAILAIAAAAARIRAAKTRGGKP